VPVARQGSRLLTGVTANIVLRVALWYAIVIGGAALAWRWLVLAGAPAGVLPGAAVQGGSAMRSALPAPGTAPATHAPAALAAMAGAALLALPVAWMYVLTRAKRGYQQSVVQTLVILPIVVAGIVALVKDSLALAFALAGIVAAVRFRTALDDSKDAVYVFLATGIGLAAAVDLPVAAALSVVFNGVILLFWYTEFGRTPAHLDGKMAERRLQRTLEQLSRTGTFVARMDNEVFRDMSAEQLQAVADRAWRRARRHDPELPDTEGRRESLLRVRTADAEGTRAALEPVLDEQVKRWRYGGTVREPDGVTVVVEYTVLLKRGTVPDELLAALREAGEPLASAVELA
jgi:hypothetical protein